MQYQRFIDGLRAVAVTSVVAFHAGLPGIPGGFVGVDIFFVISGYLITGLLLADLNEHDRIRFGVFFARRVRRLMPALILVLLVTGIAGAFILLPDELPRFRQSLHAVVMVVSNFHFLKQVGGYFAPTTDTMPLLHTWSLAVEEQYYVVWPLILFSVWRVIRGADAKWRERVLLGLFSAFFVLSLAACLVVSYRRQELAFYMMPMRAWELMAGGLLVLVQGRLRITAGAAHLMAIGGLAAIVATFLLLDASIAFPGWVALAPVLGTVAMIAGLRAASPNALLLRGLSLRPVVSVGQISYSWYLWHWPMLALVRAWNLSEKDVLRDAAVALLSLLFAWLTWRFVENPIRYQRPWLFASTRGTLGAGVAMSVLALAAGVSAIHFGKARTEAGDSAWLEIVGPANAAEAKCFAKGYGQLQLDRKECIYGDNSLVPHTMIWGDSHAAHLNPLAEEIARTKGGSVLLRGFPGCAPLAGVVSLQQRGDDDYRCTEFNDFVLAEISELAGKGLRNVILSARWPGYPASLPTDPGGGFRLALVSREDYLRLKDTGRLHIGMAPADEAGSLAMMRAGLLRDLDVIQAAGLRAVVVASVPELPFNGAHCLTRRGAEGCFVPRMRVEERRAATLAILRETIAAHPDAVLYDPLERFCDAQSCYAARGGEPMYRDDDHISRPMARRLAPDVRAFLR